MHVKKIKIRNFRNIKELDLSLNSKINLIIAPNGTGKTNLLEALHIISRGNSPRTYDDTDLIPFISSEKKEEFTKISCAISGEKEPKEVIISNPQDNNNVRIVKKYRYKGKNTTRKKFRELLHSVFFSPESIGFLTQGFSRRRDLFDMILETSDFEYSHELSRYKKALRNRNILLKKLQDNGNKDELIFWTKEIINSGSYLMEKRWKLLADFSPLLNKISRDLLNDQWISLSYLSHIDSTPLDDLKEIKSNFLNKIKSHRETEIAAGKTLSGPHRDRWIVNLDENDLSRFGSRGQQRLGILAIFLAFQDQIQELIDTPPVLLLDDITSELDKDHIELLKQKLENAKSQVFLTTTQEEIANSFSKMKKKSSVKIIELEKLLK